MFVEMRHVTFEKSVIYDCQGRVEEVLLYMKSLCKSLCCFWPHARETKSPLFRPRPSQPVQPLFDCVPLVELPETLQSKILSKM